MADQKTVFISYRRKTSAFIARAIFQELRNHDFDVFMDVESIDSGEFDTIILRQIPARAHFIFILTPGTLERCKNPGDWLLRELQRAIETGRNIVPIVLDGFDWGDLQSYLPEDVAKRVGRQNAVNVYHEYFDAAMQRLRERHLKPPEYITTTAVPDEDVAIVEERISRVESAPKVTVEQLSAEEWIHRGNDLIDKEQFDEGIEAYNQALELDPNYALAYYNLGVAYNGKEDYQTAYEKLTQAIKIDPDDAMNYILRGIIARNLKRYADAIKDQNRAILLSPSNADAYYWRGEAKLDFELYDDALRDLDIALELNPDHIDAHFARAYARSNLPDRSGIEGAIADYNAILEINPDHVESLSNRAELLAWQGQLERGLKDYMRAREISQKYPETVNGIAEVYLALGNVDEAARYNQTAYDTRPEDHHIRLTRAAVKWQQGDKQAARDIIQALIDEDPAFNVIHWVEEKFLFPEATWHIITEIYDSR